MNGLIFANLYSQLRAFCGSMQWAMINLEQSNLEEGFDSESKNFLNICIWILDKNDNFEETESERERIEESLCHRTIGLVTSFHELVQSAFPEGTTADIITKVWVCRWIALKKVSSAQITPPPFRFNNSRSKAYEANVGLILDTSSTEYLLKGI